MLRATLVAVCLVAAACGGSSKKSEGPTPAAAPDAAPVATPAGDPTAKATPEECTAVVDHLIALPASPDEQGIHDYLVQNRDMAIQQCSETATKADIDCAMQAQALADLDKCSPPGGGEETGPVKD